MMKKRWRLLVCFIILLASLALVGFGVTTLVNHYDTTETALVTRVIDGDTIEIEGGFRVRYIGIDTPEKGEYFFEEATAKNSELVLGKEVRLEKDVSETDQYGRLLRYVYVGDLFVNAELVRLGYAKSAEYPPDVKYAEYFEELENYAVLSDLGIHNEPQYSPPLSHPLEFNDVEDTPIDELSERIDELEIEIAYNEYLRAVDAWELAKAEYANGTGSYYNCVVTYNSMLAAKEKYELLKKQKDSYLIVPFTD